MRFEADFSQLVSVYTAKADNTEADQEQKEVCSWLDGLEKGLAEILKLLRGGGRGREEGKAEMRRAESLDWEDVEEDAEGEEVEEGRRLTCSYIEQFKYSSTVGGGVINLRLVWFPHRQV